MTCPADRPVELEPSRATSFATAILIAAGASESSAQVVAEHLVESDRCGVHSHGLLRVPQYVEEMGRGEIAGAMHPEIVDRRPSKVVIDGRRGFGQVAAELAADEADAAAATTGAALATAFNTGHAGRIGAYVERIAASGRVAVAFCSGPRSGHRVAPFGGVEGRLSTNPIAFGFPGDGSAVIADFSTSTVPEGVVRRLRDLGLPAPEGSLQDSSGAPTLDPGELYAEPPGTILPLGGPLFGHKGYALGLLVEAMTTVIAGENAADEQRIGNTFTILVVGAEARFATAGGALSGYVRSARPANPARPVLLPGDLERIAREGEANVRIDAGTWRALCGLAQSASIPVPEMFP